MTTRAPAQGGGAQEGVRWLSLTAAIASISVVGTAIGLSAPLLSVILEQRSYSASMIGLNTAVAGIASIAAAPIATPIAVRFGVVRTMVAMIVIGGLCFIGFYLTANFWLWFMLRAVMHVALTVLFILSEFWISASAPPGKRGFVLGIYATVLSLGFAFGPWIFAQVGSQGFAPFGLACALIIVAALPVLLARRESPDMHSENTGGTRFLSYLFLVPTATAAVLVFGAVETGGFALFPVYGLRIGYSAADAALLLSMVGLGNVLLQIPLGFLSDRMRDRRILLIACALVGLLGMIVLPAVSASWTASAVVLFIWSGVVAGMYTVGLAHLGARLSGRDLASANAAFVLCYGIGMLAGPQLIGIGMDSLGPNGFAWTLAVFFGLYVVLAGARLFART